MFFTRKTSFWSISDDRRGSIMASAEKRSDLPLLDQKCYGELPGPEDKQICSKPFWESEVEDEGWCDQQTKGLLKFLQNIGGTGGKKLPPTSAQPLDVAWTWSSRDVSIGKAEVSAADVCGLLHCLSTKPGCLQMDVDHESSEDELVEMFHTGGHHHGIMYSKLVIRIAVRCRRAGVFLRSLRLSTVRPVQFGEVGKSPKK